MDERGQHFMCEHTLQSFLVGFYFYTILIIIDVNFIIDPNLLVKSEEKGRMRELY